MDPLPDFGYDDYEGSGKLKGKVTAVSIGPQHSGLSAPRSVEMLGCNTQGGERLRYI